MMLSGSYDAYDLGGGSYTVAPWITEGGLDVPARTSAPSCTPSDYGLNLFRAVENSLGLSRLRGERDHVRRRPTAAAAGWSRRLASTCPWDATPGHNSTAVDVCAPGLSVLGGLHLPRRVLSHRGLP